MSVFILIPKKGNAKECLSSFTTLTIVLISHASKVMLNILQTAAATAKSLHSCPTLCDPIDSSPPGSSIPGILQARILEWVAISFSNACMHAKSLQSCPTLCDPIDGSPPGSSVYRILQARLLEWVVISFSSPSARLQQFVNQELSDVQAGFRKGKETRDQIADTLWIIEKAREVQKNI